MKHLSFGALAILIGLTSACATRQKLLDISGVSMTHGALQPGQKLQDKGPVTGEFCAQQFSDKGQIGLIDETVKNTQATHKVDYITNATIWTTGASCIVIEGQGQSILGQTAPSTKN